MKNDSQNSLTYKEAKVTFSWSFRSISKRIAKRELDATPFYEPTISRYDSIKCLLKISAFTLRSSGKRFFVVWHSFSFTPEENAPWKFPYVDLLLYIFMSTVSFLTTFKTYALSQVISPKKKCSNNMIHGLWGLQSQRSWCDISIQWKSLSQNIQVARSTHWLKTFTLFYCSLWET